MFQNMVSINLFDFADFAVDAGGWYAHGRGLRLVCLLPVVCEFLLSFFGEFMALYKQTEVSLSAWRCCKAPAELVAHNPLYLNDLRGRKSKLPWSNRAGMRTIACMS